VKAAAPAVLTVEPAGEDENLDDFLTKVIKKKKRGQKKEKFC
jgi:hypothetical protein